MKEAIIKGLYENDCTEKGQDEYGERFSVIMKISIFQKEASDQHRLDYPNRRRLPSFNYLLYQKNQEMKKEELKLYDTVAILKDVPERKVVFGQVGTIVEQLAEGVFEVEFADKFGESIAEFAVKSEDLMLLHYEMEFAK